MISLGIECAPPPPTKKEIREWNKWQKEMNILEEDLLKRRTTPNKKKRKNIKKRGNKN